MKKLVLLLAVVFSVSLFSCGNKAAETTEATEEATEVVAEGVEATEVEACACDTCACDTCTCGAEVVEAVVAE